MKIKVDRTIDSEGNLLFTIKVTEPHVAPFSDQERISLESIDRFTLNMSKTIDPTGPLYQDILNANHKVKEKMFCRILQNLKFAIENEFRPKFRPICQEIYNWIYDDQEGHVKKWMSEFDPQRTTYYFDNDAKSENSREQSSASDQDSKQDDYPEVEDEDESDYEDDLNQEYEEE